jgi:hypothetical protein
VILWRACSVHRGDEAQLRSEGVSQERIVQIVLSYFDSSCNGRGEGVLSFATVKDVLLRQGATSSQASGARRWIVDSNFASFIVGDRFELSRTGKVRLLAFRADTSSG